MSKSTISTFQLFALIPDAETARAYLEARLWPQLRIRRAGQAAVEKAMIAYLDPLAIAA